MARKDYLFLADANDKRVWLCFCKSDHYSREDAEQQVRNVLENIKQFNSYRLNYLGTIDYEDMDDDIINQLHYFEKHDPVWLFSMITN